ncbi:endocuticle structural protein SgAbd-6 [Scaptodrosophila lebanonensis]|uniref:Endocuticle structural protein SgAbd-6 n=1 Tax=Drosophila lebanonensis TaxID=7225 RepID=A0A6J2UI02_DROLE|nr:endocuticle structural protein SgAbd-6 [Scaptodrosophila lebanonensis]
MFKFIALLAAACALASYANALPIEAEREVVSILRSEINKNDDGSYKTTYEGSDGTMRHEEAVVVDAGTDEQALEVKGSYKYINDEGQEVEVFYTAGKNGFVPYGSIINPEITAVAEAAKDLPKYTDDKEKVQLGA